MTVAGIGVVILPTAGGDRVRACASVVAGGGGVAEIAFLDVLAGTPRAMIAAAAEAAQRQGCDWLLVLTADEILAPDALAKAAPALSVHDALFGGAALMEEGRSSYQRITRLAAQDRVTHFHAALRWWVGPSHLIRPQVALAALAEVTDGAAWRAEYLAALWRNASVLKTPQALTTFHAPLPFLADAERAALVAELELAPAFSRISCAGRVLELPYTGLNPVIEREQVRGLFFEQEELLALADRFPRGLRIVDAGANTGNHTVFFAGVMHAERVLPVEPLARAAAAIRTAVARNDLRNVDLGLLGQAIGAQSGRLTAEPTTSAGLGATRFLPDPAGAVPVVPLDDLVDEPVDLLKLDVEGMEMPALAGAARLFAVHKPALFVEVVDSGVSEFTAWLASHAYHVERLFPDKTHCNYLCLPDGRRRMRMP